MKGFFLTFEGIEGSGKSTLISLLEKRLREKGLPVLSTREPGGTAAGAGIRRILLDPASAGMTPLTELALLAADRAQHTAEVLAPALAAGMVVLCDRYSDATFAYQGYGRGLSPSLVASYDRPAQGGIAPDLTILLDLPPEKGLTRVHRRNEREGSDETRLDDEDLAFHRRVREGYLALAKADPGRFLVLDGLAAPEALADKVLTEMARRFPRVL